MELLEWFDNRKDDRDAARRAERRKKLISRGIVAAVCLILFIAGVSYTSSARTVYFWDDATYWDMSRSILSGALKGGFWQRVYGSIGTSDYNYVAALPPAAWMSVFGTGRVSYVAGLIVMYLIPSVLLIYRLSTKLSKAPMFSFITAVFMLPATLYIAAMGFADVGGLLMMLACYNLYYKRNNRDGSPIRHIFISILLVVMMIYRRYFAFFAVSFVTAMLIDCILFRRKWRNVLITGLSAAAFMLLAFLPFVTGILFKDYGALYSSYKFPITTDLKFIARYFGLLTILVLAAVPVIAWIRKRESRPVFCWVQLIVCCAMFMATQTHATHHLLLYIPAFMVLSIWLINCVSKRVSLVLLAILIAANLINPIIPREQPSNIQDIKGVAMLPSFSMLPDVRDDIDDLVKAKRKLDTVIPEGSVCGVMASSFIINDSILRNAEPSLNMRVSREPDYITALPEVDSRDHARLDEIFDSEYILVAFPAQTHLAPGEQSIVTECVRSFEVYADIATAFEEVAGFDEKVGDVTLRLYHRVDNVSEYKKSEFKKRLFRQELVK